MAQPHDAYPSNSRDFDNPLSSAHDHWTGDPAMDRELLVSRALEALLWSQRGVLPRAQEYIAQAEAEAPQFSAQTFRSAVHAAWQTHADAIVDDKYLPGHSILKLYPTDDRRDVITMHPFQGNVEYGTAAFTVERTNGKWITAKLGTAVDYKGQPLAYKSVGVKGGRFRTEPVDATETDIAQMQQAIAEASPVRPRGRIAKAVGRILHENAQ